MAAAAASAGIMALLKKFAPLLITGGAGLYDKMTQSQNYLPIDPSQYKGDITYSDADIAKIREQHLRNIKGANMATIANIKQEGSAGRMPSGAVLSNIKGVSREAGKSLGDVEPALSEIKRNAMLDFIDRQNYYRTGKQQFQQGLHDRTMGNLGALGKVAMYWSRGYFD